MNKLLTALFLTFSMSTLVAAERNPDFKELQGLSPEALLVHALEQSMGTSAAAAALSEMTGAPRTEAEENMRGKNVLRLAQMTPAYENFIKQHKSDLREKRLELGCLRLYLSAFSEHLKTHNNTEPDKPWLEANLPLFVEQAKKSQQPIQALEIIKKHAGPTTERYLADRERAIKKGQPMGRFQGPIDKVVTYLQENNGKVPSKDWLSQNLWPS